ncbi:MAG: hypothetical protein ACXACP_06835 [Candidatus Hodarchaeales archaeon]|jgi:hypothetical protein
MKNQENSQTNTLEKEGWTKKFTVEAHRVEEYVNLYKSLGQEVYVESTIPDDREECQVCFETECDRFKTIYTRKEKKEDI